LGSGNNGDKNRTWNAIEAEITNNVNNDGSDMGIRINPTYGYCYKFDGITDFTNCLHRISSTFQWIRRDFNSPPVAQILYVIPKTSTKLKWASMDLY
jgi:hypothetical protein